MVDYRGLFICVPLYIMAIILLSIKIATGLFVFHVAVVPLVFKYSKTFRRNLVFANFVQWPLRVDYDRPAANGIEGCRNFCLKYQSKVDNCPITIGIWHILPKSAYERLKDKFERETDKEDLHRLLDEELANPRTPIIMYCHGNANSRAASHRVELYKFFQQMDFHTIAFDYRGYGDSTNISPSEDGVVEDSLMVYEWIHKTIDKGNVNPPVFIWGHSLGTGISSHLVGNLDDLSWRMLETLQPLPAPNGLILEAPFTNLADEVAHHPASKLVTWLPYYEQAFIAPFYTAPEYAFRSDMHLKRVNTLPVLILHAEDDNIVPLGMGRKLYNSLLEARCANDNALVQLHEYPKSEGLGHKWICRAKDLHKVVGEFVSEHKSKHP